MSENVPSENLNKKNKLFSDAIHCTLDFLYKKNYLTEGTDTVSRQAAILGQEIFAYLENLRNNLLNEQNDVELCPKSISQKRASVDSEKINASLIPKKKICVVSSCITEEKRSDEKLKNKNKNECKNVDCDVKEKNENECEKKNDEKVVKNNDENLNVKKNLKTGDEADEGVKIEEEKKGREYKTTRSRNVYRIPLDLKKKIVEFAKKNPTMRLSDLERLFGCSLSTKQQLRRWEQEVNQGGTVLDRRAMIYAWVYKKVCENKKKNVEVTTTMLQAWALEANNKYFPPQKNRLLAFSATRGWVQRFKNWCKAAESSSHLHQKDSSSSKSDNETADKLPKETPNVTAVATSVLSLSPRRSTRRSLLIKS